MKWRTTPCEIRVAFRVCNHGDGDGGGGVCGWLFLLFDAYLTWLGIRRFWPPILNQPFTSLMALESPTEPRLFPYLQTVSSKTQL